jgi:hypothetical protein
MASLACFQGSSRVWRVAMATKITGHGLNVDCRSMTHLYHGKKEFDRMTQTIWDTIATAAADGYNNIGLSIRDYNYGGPDLYVWHEHGWTQYTASINVRPYFDEEQFTGRPWRNQYEKRHCLIRIIEEYLKRHGYEVIEKNMCDSYYDADKIVIKW